MSLATTTTGGVGGMMGGGGAMGMSMAHSAHSATAMAQTNVQLPPPEIPGGTSTTTAVPSSNIAALAADIVDKQQQLTLKQVRDLSKFPIVALDLYSKEPIVAMFPPKQALLDPSSTSATAATADDDPVRASVVGKMKDKIVMKTTETAHKTLRKWLSKAKGYPEVQADVLITTTAGTITASSNDNSNHEESSQLVVTIERPELWLGLRRLQDGPSYLKKMVTLQDTPQDDGSNNESHYSVIAEEEPFPEQGVIGVSLTNGTLDGSIPQGDDFDRVVCKLRLHESKKALTILPEEMLQLIINQAQYYVSRQFGDLKAKINNGNDDHDDDDDEDDIDEIIMNYPCAIAVPAPYCNDRSVEALMDATGNIGVMFHRNVCGLAGALIPSNIKEKPNTILLHLQNVLQERHKEFQKKQVKNPNATFDDTLLVVVTGMTRDTAESTAIQISSQQNDMISCRFGNFRVMSNVSYRIDARSMYHRTFSKFGYYCSRSGSTSRYDFRWNRHRTKDNFLSMGQTQKGFGRLGKCSTLYHQGGLCGNWYRSIGCR
jgi:hypothetical protein